MEAQSDRKLLRRFLLAFVEATNQKSPSLMLLRIGQLRAEAIALLRSTNASEGPASLVEQIESPMADCKDLKTLEAWGDRFKSDLRQLDGLSNRVRNAVERGTNTYEWKGSLRLGSPWAFTDDHSDTGRLMSFDEWAHRVYQSLDVDARGCYYVHAIRNLGKKGVPELLRAIGRYGSSKNWEAKP